MIAPEGGGKSLLFSCLFPSIATFGYSPLPIYSVVPKPYLLWPTSFQKAIFPLNMVFSFGWSLELYVLFPCFCDAILSDGRLALNTLI